MLVIQFLDYLGILLLATWPLLCGGCQTTTAITLSDNNSTSYENIFSPNWPADYPDGASVCWRISSNSSTRPRLDIREVFFAVELCGSCRCDYLRLNDPTRESAWSFCGDHAFGRFITEGGTVNLEFASDHAVNYKGFHILVEITADYPDYSLSTWAIVTITLISLALVVLLGGMLIMYLKSRKAKRTTAQSASTNNAPTVDMTATNPSYTGSTSVSATIPYITMPVPPPVYSESAYPYSTYSV